MPELPLFPLNAVLFPGTPIQLHIFEDRYLEMMRVCLHHSQPFGVVLIRSGMEALGPLPQTMDIGCSANIVDVETLSDGRMNITAVGEDRFRIRGFTRERPYLTAAVMPWPFSGAYEPAVAAGVRALMPLVTHYLSGLSRMVGMPEKGFQPFSPPDDTLLRLCLAAALLQVPNREKQQLLGAFTAPALLENVTRVYRRENSLMARLIGVREDDAERVAALN